ncbi:hypothetical protein [Jiella sp. M17.18]|uniref:hypothetical protein n=1 Tax=Jiella sp. M17.18 TaxID=3234247 RepID=UPI0034E00549
MRRTSVILSVATAMGLTAAPMTAHAFSQIEGAGGSAESKDGIIAVPLPPLTVDQPHGQDQSTGPQGRRGSGAAPEGTDAGEVPISPEDEAREKLRRERMQGPNLPAAKKPGRAPGANGTVAPVRRQDPENARDQVSPDDAPTDDGREMRLRVPSGYTARTEAAPGGGGARSLRTIVPDAGDRARKQEARPERQIGPTEALPAKIAYGADDLPKPVRDLRARLMDIARTGDIDRLRPYIKTGDGGTVLSFGDVVDDPIAFLKSASADGNGVEVLAILLEILEAGHVHVDAGGGSEIYVWPYFTQLDIEKLTKPQLVELFELVTAGDYEAMKEFGAYDFYRVGISPDGRLEFFVTGD